MDLSLSFRTITGCDGAYNNILMGPTTFVGDVSEVFFPTNLLDWVYNSNVVYIGRRQDSKSEWLFSFLQASLDFGDIIPPVAAEFVG